MRDQIPLKVKSFGVGRAGPKPTRDENPDIIIRPESREQNRPAAATGQALIQVTAKPGPLKKQKLCAKNPCDRQSR
jgi:hypothetical protein